MLFQGKEFITSASRIDLNRWIWDLVEYKGFAM